MLTQQQRFFYTATTSISYPSIAAVARHYPGTAAGLNLLCFHLNTAAFVGQWHLMACLDLLSLYLDAVSLSAMLLPDY